MGRWRRSRALGREGRAAAATAVLVGADPADGPDARSSNQFLAFGGTLLAGALADGTVTSRRSSRRAPIVRWAGHSQGVDALVDEIGAFFARLKVPVDFQEGAEERISGADPEALYAVFLQHSIGRLHRSRTLRDADPHTAGWLEHEGYRMAHDSPRHWAGGQELLAFLDLG